MHISQERAGTEADKSHSHQINGNSDRCWLDVWPYETQERIVTPSESSESAGSESSEWSEPSRARVGCACGPSWPHEAVRRAY